MPEAPKTRDNDRERERQWERNKAWAQSKQRVINEETNFPQMTP